MDIREDEVYAVIESMTPCEKKFFAKSLRITSPPCDCLSEGVKNFQNANSKSEKLMALNQWKNKSDNLLFTDKMQFNTMTFSF